MAADTTTIRVSAKTKNRLGKLAVDDLTSANTDEIVQYLLDYHWKNRLVEQWDDLREQDPAGFRQYLAGAAELDRNLTEPLDTTGLNA